MAVHGSARNMPPAFRFFFARIFPLIFIVAGADVLYVGINGWMNARESSEATGRKEWQSSRRRY